jgi:hypothetical protein
MTMPDIKDRMRAHLCAVAATGIPTTYQALAVALELTPPQTIRQVTDMLEVLMAEDVAAGRPMIAALVISKSGSGLPALGFFECAARLGRFDGDVNGPEAVTFYQEELLAAKLHS